MQRRFFLSKANYGKNIKTEYPDAIKLYITTTSENELVPLFYNSGMVISLSILDGEIVSLSGLTKMQITIQSPGDHILYIWVDLIGGSLGYGRFNFGPLVVRMRLPDIPIVNSPSMFYSSEGLKRIDCLADIPFEFTLDKARDLPNLEEVHIPYNSTSLYTETTGWSTLSSYLVEDPLNEDPYVHLRYNRALKELAEPVLNNYYEIVNNPDFCITPIYRGVQLHQYTMLNRQQRDFSYVGLIESFFESDTVFRMGRSMGYASSPYNGTVSYYGYNIIVSFHKPYLDNCYIYDKTSLKYLWKGKNVK